MLVYGKLSRFTTCMVFLILGLPFHVADCIFVRNLKVNPIAVNSKYCNVFTENKRVVCIISTADFGKVCCRNLIFFIVFNFFA